MKPNNEPNTWTPQSTESGRAQLKRMFREKAMLERLEPAWHLLKWMLNGRPESEKPQSVLPDYCYEIIERFRGSYCKIVPTIPDVMKGDLSGLPKNATSEQVKQHIQIDWTRLGRVVGMTTRFIQFLTVDLESKMQNEGLFELKCQEDEEILNLIAPRSWLESKGFSWLLDHEAIEGNQIPEKVTEFAAQTLRSISASNILALHCGAEATAEFQVGNNEGFTGLINTKGELAGETTRAGIYLFLLICWPEIKAMQESLPAQTRKDFDLWLEPFRKDGIVTLNSLEQINDVCDDIGLRFKGRGRPRAKQKLPSG